MMTRTNGYRGGRLRFSLLALVSIVFSLAASNLFAIFADRPVAEQDFEPHRVAINVTGKIEQAERMLEIVPWNESFAACMVWKDDNHHLIEWLAYHYQRLPLRRVIIGVDRYARHTISPIVSRYNSLGLMNITVWQDEDYMHNADLALYNLPNKSAQQYVNLHRRRQRELYRHCMLQLMSEETKWSWTAFIDWDEFVTVNDFVDPLVARKYPTVQDAGRSNWTWFEWLKRAEASNYRLSMFQKPCVLLPRVTYGSEVSTRTKNESRHSNESFDRQRFSTYQWKHSAGPKRRIGMHKAIVNLRRVRQMRPDIAIDLEKKMKVEIHLPIPLCPKKNLQDRIPRYPFRLNHYVGSREQFFFRTDYRADAGIARTEDAFEWRNRGSSKHFDTSHETFMAQWLDGFVENVGLNVARQLLEGVGELDASIETNHSRPDGDA